MQHSIHWERKRTQEFSTPRRATRPNGAGASEHTACSHVALLLRFPLQMRGCSGNFHAWARIAPWCDGLWQLILRAMWLDYVMVLCCTNCKRNKPTYNMIQKHDRLLRWGTCSWSQRWRHQLQERAHRIAAPHPKQMFGPNGRHRQSHAVGAALLQPTCACVDLPRS